MSKHTPTRSATAKHDLFEARWPDLQWGCAPKPATEPKRAPQQSSNMSSRRDRIEAKMSLKCFPKGSLEASGRALGGPWAGPGRALGSEADF